QQQLSQPEHTQRASALAARDLSPSSLPRTRQSLNSSSRTPPPHPPPIIPMHRLPSPMSSKAIQTPPPVKLEVLSVNLSALATGPSRVVSPIF
ncbi:hypothetical protein BGZ88_003884, partial [Linnemannia elongata]